MKKYVSRRKNKAAIVLLWSFLLIFILGYLTSTQVIMLIAVPLFIVAVILMFTANRCPHCGAAFLGLYWSEPDAGYCNACGNLIEFDDSEEEYE